ncbi:hypothetical protein [Spirillospora sp. CA-128828]|uniref:hypothetical protein n=1 Tax=Spirillospora sp. CA-128828 TaxID=3240033 RepID=UPI003D910A53
MRDPYNEDELRDAEMARIRARLAELERPPGQGAVPRELEELLNSDAPWRSGPVPIPPSRLLTVKFRGRAGLATAQDVLRYLEAPEATSGPATGRLGPVTRRYLPPPLAGYAEDGHVVLADWLDKGDARRVLRVLRGGQPDRRPDRLGERRLWSVALLPALLGLRWLRDLGQLATLSPATGTTTATATCTGTMTGAVSGTVAAAVTPLATAAAIMSTPATLPVMQSALAPVVRPGVAVVEIVPARDEDPLTPPLPALPAAEPVTDSEPEAADPEDSEPIPPPATVPAGVTTAEPTAEPTASATPAPSATPSPEPSPSTSATEAESSTPPSTKPAAQPTPTQTTASRSPAPTPAPSPSTEPVPAAEPPEDQPPAPRPACPELVPAAPPCGDELPGRQHSLPSRSSQPVSSLPPTCKEP